MVRMTALPLLLCALVWPAGRPAQSGSPASVAFHSNYEGVNSTNNSIYVMDADGSNPIRRSFDTNNNQRAEVSPDGRHIVFASNRLALGTHFQIFVMNADGTGVRRLLEPPNATTNTWPRW